MQRFFRVGICGFLVVASTAPAFAQVSSDTAPTATLPARAITAFPQGWPARMLIVIQGSARDAADVPMAGGVMRLRDARYGRVVDSKMTDAAGLFEFRTAEPGSYVVELMGVDRHVLAASQLLHVNAGQSVFAMIKLPSRRALLGGLLGHNAQQAAALVAAAAASGVLATNVVGADASANLP